MMFGGAATASFRIAPHQGRRIRHTAGFSSVQSAGETLAGESASRVSTGSESGQGQHSFSCRLYGAGETLAGESASRVSTGCECPVRGNILSVAGCSLLGKAGRFKHAEIQS